MENKIKIIKALDNEVRYKILRLLSEREGYACHISSIIQKNQPSVSSQLSKLYNLGFLGLKRMATKDVII